jgi:hypothetical protein
MSANRRWPWLFLSLPLLAVIIVGHEQNLAYLLLTYCSVVARYGSTPEEVREAVEIASHLATSPIPEYQRKEAKLYLGLFEQRHPAKV